MSGGVAAQPAADAGDLRIGPQVVRVLAADDSTANSPVTRQQPQGQPGSSQSGSQSHDTTCRLSRVLDMTQSPPFFGWAPADWRGRWTVSGWQRVNHGDHLVT